MAGLATPTTPLARVGGGIAAEAMALALAGAGREVAIVSEQGPATPGGVQLAPNAWAALECLGLGQAAREKGRMLSSLRLVGLSSGISLATLPLNGTVSRSPYASMARADLVKLLARAADGTGRVTRVKARLAKITQRSGKVALGLEGGQSLAAQWLVGCDGADGISRAFVEAGAGRKPLRVRSVFRAAIPGAPSDRPPPGGVATTVWLGRGGHAVHYPLADGTVNLVVVVGASPAAREKAVAMMAKQPLLARFSAAIESAPELPLLEYGPLDAWQRGRVILAGDAAHPMPPHLAQGAGQSLVDASELAKTLDRHGGKDLQPVFTSWSAGRIRAIRGISRDARKAGAIFALDGPTARLRDVGLSAFGDLVLGRLLDRLWSA